MSAYSDQMNGPGDHEDAASQALANDHTEDAKVYALLVLASAVNRLADAQETIANAR